MNYDEEFGERVRRIVAEDPRFPEDAYDFVREAVSFTTTKMRPGRGSGGRRHVSGRELLEGIRELALREFGPLAMAVFEAWSIRRTEDFGSIVFNLVNHNLLGASKDDSPDDFANGYDFNEAFVAPFVDPGPIPDDLPKIA